MPPRAMAARTALAAAVAMVAAACGQPSPGAPGRPPSPQASDRPTRPVGTAPANSGGPAAPGPAHTVVVILDNHSYSDVIGSGQAPFLNALARRGMLLTDSHGVTHPSEPNYLALFSGSTQGVTDDSCPHRFSGPNLASELISAHRTFAGYSESLPRTGSWSCSAGEYARKHVPWADFTNVPASASKPFTAFPAGDYGRLPTVSFVIPNLCHDMHDCPVRAGDAWLASHLGGYASWAMSHDSLLIVTWDENDGVGGNQIATIFEGQHVQRGRYGRPVTHYGVLRTIESLYRLPPAARSADAAVIPGAWS